MNKTYCYIRTSTDKQEYLRQENILKEKGYMNGVNCDYIEETFTGKTVKRPVFQDLINNKIEKGDTIVTTELSRISRSVKDFNNLIDEIVEKKKVNICILKENFNLLANGQMDAMTKLIMHITSAFAEFERNIISERTIESLKAKKINGTKSGNPIGKPRSNKSTKENFIKTLQYMIDNKVGQSKATLLCNYPKDTFQRDLKKCYTKYNTKNYQEILNILKEDTTEWEQF